MGGLIGAGPRHAMLPVELRIHAAEGGLCDLLAGRVDVDEFADRCIRHWWRRGIRGTGGLQLMIDRAALTSAVERFRAGYDEDRIAASRSLVDAVAAPVAQREGKTAWVDVSGANVARAPALVELFPRARFVHMVRDGRAVVASMLKKTGMTDDPAEALGVWEGRVRAAHAAIRALPAGTILSVDLDELVALDREGTFRRVVEFLEVDDDSAMRRHFDERISGESAHFGRWRERMGPAEARRVDRRYRRLVSALRRDGVSWAPEPREGRRRGVLGSARASLSRSRGAGGAE
jgi:hypothetical protein